jgi:hypothetical protein
MAYAEGSYRPEPDALLAWVAVWERDFMWMVTLQQS